MLMIPAGGKGLEETAHFSRCHGSAISTVLGGHAYIPEHIKQHNQKSDMGCAVRWV